jgi:GMP synthase-like glutamine amidotransferase
MNNVLIIDHGSDLTIELRNELDNRDYSSLQRQYNNLNDIKLGKFSHVISEGGKTPNPEGREIVENKSLDDELSIWKKCETDGIPMVSMGHGAQIGTYQAGGELVKLAEARNGNFEDYNVLTKGDPLLEGVENLCALEWHTYGIQDVGPDYDILMKDSIGMVQIARHNKSPVYIVQFHPEAIRPKEGEPKTNAMIILDNFLRMER